MLKRREIVDLTVEKTGDYKKHTWDALNAIFEVLREQLLEGEEIRIPRFGKFWVETRPPRRYKNFRGSRGLVYSKPKKVVKFSPSRTLAEEVLNNGEQE